MAIFLILEGVTGSLLAFKSDLERLICPQIYATPRPGVPPLDLATLAERARTWFRKAGWCPSSSPNPIRR